MKTLVFCTSWFRNHEEWLRRYQKWHSHISASGISHNGVAFIDDGSQDLCCVTDVTRCSPDALPLSWDPGNPLLVSFDKHLGRQSSVDFPGWWRSFLFAGRLARHYGFQKIIHVESDAYIISGRLVRYINDLNIGWTALWCPRWRFPESAIQVICNDQIGVLMKLELCEASWRTGLMAEHVLPFTRVEQGFKGDRLGQFRSGIPPTVDYAAQVPAYMSVPSEGGGRKRLLLLTCDLARLPSQALFPDDAWEYHNFGIGGVFAELRGTLEGVDHELFDAVHMSISSSPQSLSPQLITRILGALKTDAIIFADFHGARNKSWTNELANMFTHDEKILFKSYFSGKASICLIGTRELSALKNCDVDDRLAHLVKIAGGLECHCTPPPSSGLEKSS